MRENVFNQKLMKFLERGVTPFHVVKEASAYLESCGFLQLDEAAPWSLVPESRYFVTRNDGSLIALRTGKAPGPDTGIRMVGAHTDSPCLKVKPRPEIARNGYVQLGVEVYGGALLNPWFDRDLAMAGRVSYRTADGRLAAALIDFRRPVAVVPNLAIHFDRNANRNKRVNPQEDMPPVLFQAEKSPDFRELLLEQLCAEHPECDAAAVLDFDICLYDTQPPRQTGLKQEFLASARLDNLLSCFAGLAAIAEVETALPALLVLNDHEEVGSMSAAGAQGPFLDDLLHRLLPDPESRLRTLARSILVSADDAHGLNPNYAAKYDGKHSPLLNHGPVIKINASQRYASTAETAAWFRNVCAAEEVPVQEFVMRSDLACGSTIGPLTAGRIGVRTVDVGVPIFAMHSIRETAGIKDPHYLFRALDRHFSAPAGN